MFSPVHNTKMYAIFGSNDDQDSHQSHELHYLLKIDLCIEFFLTLIGNGLCLLVMNYEHFGGDPMKRGIENKLISSVCFAQIVGMFSSATMSMIRALYGPVNIIIAISTWFILGVSNHFASITIMIIFSNKNLNILAFNFVSHMEENFWFCFLQIINVSLSTILCFIVYFLSQDTFPFVCVFAGLPITSEYSKGTFPLMALGTFIAFSSHLIIIIYKTIQNHKSENESQVKSNYSINLFNNLVHNPNILNDLQLFLVCTAFLVTGLIPLAINKGQPADTPDALFWNWLPNRWVFGFINPMMFFYFNPAIGAHFKRTFWDDWAPEWMEKYNPYIIPLEASLPKTVPEPSKSPSFSSKIEPKNSADQDQPKSHVINVRQVANFV